MKLLLVLCALIATVSSYGWNANPYPQPNPFGYDENPFYAPDRYRHRGHRYDSRSWEDSRDSDEDDDDYSFEGGRRRHHNSGSFEDGYFYLPSGPRPNYGGNTAQDPSTNYGSASNDAPAQGSYGSPVTTFGRK